MKYGPLLLVVMGAVFTLHSLFLNGEKERVMSTLSILTLWFYLALKELQ